MNTTREQQLRQRAYRIWESEGRPDGMDAEHWARAERELSSEESGPDATPASRPRRKASAAEKPAAAAPARKKAAPRKTKD